MPHTELRKLFWHCAAGGFAGGLDGREQQGDQDADDGDHGQ